MQSVPKGRLGPRDGGGGVTQTWGPARDAFGALWTEHSGIRLGGRAKRGHNRQLRQGPNGARAGLTW